MSGFATVDMEPVNDLEENWPSNPARHPAPHSRITLVRASDIEATPIEWLWKGRLALGKNTLIAGDPGLGKTQAGLDIAARLSTGDRWPDGGVAPIGNSIIMSAEDGIGDTIVPRLEAGADLSRVLCLKGTKSPDGTQSMFTLQRDLDELGKAIAQIGGAKYIMIDPVTAYMGKIDSHRTTDVRAVLAPLTEFAEAHNVAVLSITHPPKASQAKAIHAFTGSLAHVAAARMAFLVEVARFV
jgi:RecA-family ATPase